MTLTLSQQPQTPPLLRLGLAHSRALVVAPATLVHLTLGPAHAVLDVLALDLALLEGALVFELGLVLAVVEFLLFDEPVLELVVGLGHDALLVLVDLPALDEVVFEDHHDLAVGHVVELLLAQFVLLVGLPQLLNALVRLGDHLLDVLEGVVLLHQLFDGGLLHTLEEGVDVVDVLDQFLVLRVVVALFDVFTPLVEYVLVDECPVVHVLQLLLQHHQVLQLFLPLGLLLPLQTMHLLNYLLGGDELFLEFVLPSLE